MQCEMSQIQIFKLARGSRNQAMHSKIDANPRDNFLAPEVTENISVEDSIFVHIQNGCQLGKVLTR